MLQRVFLGRWLQGRGEGLLSAMVYDLAAGLIISHRPGATTVNAVVPEQLAQTTPTIEAISELLSDNLWFMVALLIPLYISLPDIEKQIPKT